MQPYLIPNPLRGPIPRTPAPLCHTMAGQAMTVLGMIPIIEVERNEGSNIWWSMPADSSSIFYQAYSQNLATEFTFVWDWQGQKSGAFEMNGEKSNYSRYSLCFKTMLQKNLDSGRVRRFRVVFMKPDDALASQ